jgi:aminoglycoside phosphotransferase (APT) family kinase protein
VADRAAAITAWYRHTRPEAEHVVVVPTETVGHGYSNEVVFARVELTVDGSTTVESVVVRLPPSGPPLFPSYDLGMQATAQDVAHQGGVPVPRPLSVELDESWLGVPFLVMPQVEGRHPGEAPALTDWLVEAPESSQRALHTGFLDVLATLHRIPWEGTAVEGVLRRAASLVDEIAWWEDFSAWACEGRSASPLLELFARCRDLVPEDDAPASILWGDVRLGNVVVDDAFGVAAVLDWEMATLGPAESDVAWYTALSAMTDHFVGVSLPGFLDRVGVVAHVETALGRELCDLAWHESFAMARAAAAGFRTRVVAALVGGHPLPDPGDDAVVRYAAAHAAR